MSIVSVNNLSKQYRIGTRESYKSLRESIMNVVTAPAKWFRKDPDTEDNTIWALKDVSFEVNDGDVVGIIGRNGAGKSTLLKILSRITEPTAGEIKIKGRVASLLEVGTGFHPELTGRENIYLNGAVLGMTRAEINRKFDEIVAFAEIEKFLDTPVKRYSSGMYVRLAFAVAAHLEPEILVVDEVLAVGDAEFQKKCLGKMGEVAKGGRTVLFVSHNMTAVSNLCSRLILLNKGAIDFIGDVDDGIAKYLSSTMRNNSVDLNDLSNHNAPCHFSRFIRIEILNSQNKPVTEFRIGEKFKVELEFVLLEDVNNFEIGFAIQSLSGTRLSSFMGEWEGLPIKFPRGKHVVLCDIPSLLCLPGVYGVTPWIKRNNEGTDDQVDMAVQFNVIGTDITGFNPNFERYSNMGVYQKSNWQVVI